MRDLFETGLGKDCMIRLSCGNQFSHLSFCMWAPILRPLIVIHMSTVRTGQTEGLTRFLLHPSVVPHLQMVVTLRKIGFLWSNRSPRCALVSSRQSANQKFNLSPFVESDGPERSTLTKMTGAGGHPCSHWETAAKNACPENAGNPCRSAQPFLVLDTPIPLRAYRYIFFSPPLLALAPPRNVGALLHP